jgi:hypothetical protein
MVKKAVLIGINYKGTQEQLNGCINDIQNINGILRNNCGYNSADIKILTEESNISPTRANMEANINWLMTGNNPGDTLFFYYSGHGASFNDRNGDETDGKDEVLVPLDFKERGVITDDWLYTNMVCRVGDGINLWAFTDCCHSGTMIDLKYNYNSLCALKSGQLRRGMVYTSADWTDRFAFTLQRTRDVRGKVCLFSGCQDSETSADAFIQNLHQGAFTYCFIETIKNNLVRQPNGSFRFENGKMKLRNILKEINCRLDINGFGGQNCQMSLSAQQDLERTLDL